MSIAIILSALFVPAGVMTAFSVIKKNASKIGKRMSDEKFTVRMPDYFAVLGIIICVIITAFILGFTFLSEEFPPVLFYICFGLFMYLGIYMIFKAYTFRVHVKGNEITVVTAFRKPYTFTFSEIASALRQVKQNQVKSERIVIRTNTGRKLIVESAEVSYARFSKRLQEEVSRERLTGF